MLDLLILLFAAVICLGYSYLCFFQKDKVAWVVTNPMSGNSYREFLTFHAIISLLIGVSCLIGFILKLLG